jgi:hypothetical protein
MIKVKVIEDFTLKDFSKLKNIVRVKTDVEGRLFKGDTFECTEEMARYLTGENVLGKTVVEFIEVKPEEDIEIKREVSIEDIDEVKKEKPKKKKK